MKRRCIVILLAAVLAVMLLPQAALAADDEFVYDGIKYKVLTDPVGATPGTVEVIQHSYGGDSYTIPASVPNAGNNYSVTEIQASAFIISPYLSDITAASVTSIGDDAFHACYGLNAVYFPAATSIGKSAFFDCLELSITSFPAAMSIGEKAFGSCWKLPTASFPAVTSIGKSAFFNCFELASLSLPAVPPTVEDENAFDYCPSTRDLTLVNASGVALTGQALNDAIDAYDNDTQSGAGTPGDGKWFGWTLPARATAPVITTQPADQSVIAGNAATFTVGATGNPAPTYQWQVKTSTADWTDVSGATSVSYNTAATTTAMNGYQYRCVVSNGISPDATSNAVTLTVAARTYAVTVTNGIADKTTAAQGDTVTITAATAQTGQRFKEWTTSDGVTFVDSTAATTTFSMPAKAVAVTATYELIPTPPISITPAATITQGSAPGNLTLNIGSAGSPPNDSTHFGSLEISPNGTSYTTVSVSNYTLSYGSIHVMLRQSWLNTLAPGTYTLRVNLAGAYAGISPATRLTVIAPPKPPKTGDSATPLLWLSMLTLGGIGFALLMRRRRRV